MKNNKFGILPYLVLVAVIACYFVFKGIVVLWNFLGWYSIALLLIVIAGIFASRRHKKKGFSYKLPSFKFSLKLNDFAIIVIGVALLGLIIWGMETKAWHNFWHHTVLGIEAKKPVYCPDRYPAIETVQFMTQRFEHGKKYKFLMPGRDVRGPEYWFTPEQRDTAVFSFEKIGSEHNVHWQCRVVRDGNHVVRYEIMQDKLSGNDGTGGWCTVSVDHDCFVVVSPKAVSY